MKNLPEEFVTRMKDILGEEYEQYESSIHNSPVRAFRVNTDKISVKDFEKSSQSAGGGGDYCRRPDKRSEVLFILQRGLWRCAGWHGGGI